MTINHFCFKFKAPAVAGSEVVADPESVAPQNELEPSQDY